MYLISINLWSHWRYLTPSSFWYLYVLHEDQKFSDWRDVHMNRGAIGGRSGIVQAQIFVSPPAFLVFPSLELHQEQKSVNFYCYITSYHLKQYLLIIWQVQGRNLNRFHQVLCSGLRWNEGITQLGSSLSENLLPSSFRLWQNLLPWGCRSEVPTSVWTVGQGHSLFLEATHIPSHMALSVFKAAMVCHVLLTLLTSDCPSATSQRILSAFQISPDWVRPTQIISMS